MMHEAVGHAFTNNIHCMTNSFQNSMIKALKEGASAKFVGPCNQQQVASIPGSSNTVHAETGDQLAEQVAHPVPLQAREPTCTPVFTASLLLTSSSVQDGTAAESPSGWDPKTGLGMPTEFLNIATQNQTATGASPASVP